MPDPVGDLLLEDTLTAIDGGLDTEWYLAARAAGATHSEALATSTGNLPWCDDYINLRRLGLTHAQAHQVGALTTPVYTYTLAYTAGATHQEILEYLATKAPLTPYTWCRQAGATHAETLAIVASTTPDTLAQLTWHYAEQRRLGASHLRALAFVASPETIP